MTHLFLMKQTTSFVFVYSLLCLWAPLVMIALLPFVITAAAFHWFHDRRSVITIENSLGAGSLAAVFVIFYAAGSGSANPSFWTMGAFEGYRKAWALVLFYLFAWGIYAAAVTPFVWRSESPYRVWFSCLGLTMGLLPLWSFGEWSDLLCRGSAPLMFLLLVFILRAVRHYWSENRRAAAVGLLCLLLPGAGSALLQIRMALVNYGRTRPVRSIVTYSHAYPNLGPDDTLFEKLLRRSLPERPRSERGGPPPRQHP
jgi:hypothetical protein